MRATVSKWIWRTADSKLSRLAADAFNGWSSSHRCGQWIVDLVQCRRSVEEVYTFRYPTPLPTNVRMISVSSAQWCPYSNARLVVNAVVGYRPPGGNRVSQHRPYLVDLERNQVVELGDSVL